MMLFPSESSSVESVLNCNMNAMADKSAAADTSVADKSVAADDESADQTAALDSLFIEQPSIVPGIRSLVKEFSTCFPETMPAGLPPEREIAHAIPMQPGHAIPSRKLHRLSRAQEEEMISQVQQLLDKGWIQPSSSPYGSPILFVKKKDGGMRMCVDYRAVNKLTVKNSYPLPRIDDMLDRLAGAKIFSALDLQQAYHQVRLNPEDVPKTAFTTSMGLFEYKVLPFGLSNAPSTFQALINSILGPELRHCCLVYLDDIIIFSKNTEEHLVHLRAVLERLRSAHLFAKLSKCKFALSFVKFLGHIVSAAGIQPDPDKVAIVRDWPVPADLKATRQFVGLAQYFRKFIQGFPTMIAPLTTLFKKDVPWVWTPKCQHAFESVKQALLTAPCLRLPDEAPFTVICDASGLGIGAVLLQEGRPVAFDGRKLTDAEKNWSATEQEMLAVVHHLEKWRCYLEGRHFTVVTDHQPNTWFATQKVLTPRLARWYEKLRSYDFTWEYKPGRINVADPLSRNPAFVTFVTAAELSTSDLPASAISAITLRSSGPAAMAPPSVAHPTRHAREVRDMIRASQSTSFWGERESGDDVMHGAKVPSDGVSLPSSVDLPSLQSGQTLLDLPEDQSIMQNEPVLTGQSQPDQHRRERSGVVNPISRSEPLTAELDIANLQNLTPSALGPADGLTDVTDVSQSPMLTDVADVLQSILSGYDQDPLFDASHEAERVKLGWLSKGGLHMRGDAVVVPDFPDLRRKIIRELHCSPYCGHFGYHRTQKLICRYYFWPNMQKEIQNYVRGCELCQRNKSAPGAKAGKLLPLPVPEGIWEDISMDFVGPLPETARGMDQILVVVDRLSKMAHFLPCKTTITGPEVARLFVDRIWSLHGLPKSIVTDRGTNFLNEWNSSLLKLLGTRHCVTSSYHPESDGQTERVNRVLCEMLRHYVNHRYDDWDLHLPIVEFAHNNAYSSATDQTPFFVCYGKHPRTPVSAVIDAALVDWKSDDRSHKHFQSISEFLTDRRLIVHHAQAAMESARQRMQRQTHGQRKALTFQVGDQVSLKTKHLGLNTLPSKKLFPKYLGPFTVHTVINQAAYQLELPNHWKCHNVFHVSLLKPFLSNGEDFPPQSFTLKGGSDHEFEVESIFDFGPKTRHQSGRPRKVSELTFHVKWRGLRQGLDEQQPYANVKGNAAEALEKLASSWKLPVHIFAKGSNTLPVDWDPVSISRMTQAVTAAAIGFLPQKRKWTPIVFSLPTAKSN